MTIQYTIELTDAENKALAYIASSQQEWIENVVKERCRIAIDDIVSSEVNRLLSLGQPITGSKEEIVMNAPITLASERVNNITSV